MLRAMHCHPAHPWTDTLLTHAPSIALSLSLRHLVAGDRGPDRLPIDCGASAGLAAIAQTRTRHALARAQCPRAASLRAHRLPRWRAQAAGEPTGSRRVAAMLLARAWLRPSSCQPAAILCGLLSAKGSLLCPRHTARRRPCRRRGLGPRGAARSTSDAAPQPQLSGLGLLAMLPARRRPGWSPERPRACACVVRVCRCCVPRAAGFARARTCSRQVCVLTTTYSHHNSYKQHRHRV